MARASHTKQDKHKREREKMSKIKYEPEIDDLIKMKEEEEGNE
jgi:hypothetical protein